MLNQNYKYSSYINNICVCVLFFDFIYIYIYIYIVFLCWTMWSLVVFDPDYDLTRYKSVTIFNGNF